MDLGFFKRHPYLTGGVVVVGGVVFFMFFTANSGGSVQAAGGSGGDPNQLALQLAQMQQSTASTGIAAQLEAKRIESATAIELGHASFDLEALKVAASQIIGLGSIDAQNKATAADLEAFRIQSGNSLEAAKLNYQLQDTIAARAQYNEIQAGIRQNEQAAWNYNLQYQQMLVNRDLQASLIDKLKAA